MRSALVAAVIAVTLATGTGTAGDGNGLIPSARGLPVYGPIVPVGTMPPATGTPHTNFLRIADFNGDGLPDVLATRGQWHSGTLYTPVVFVNNGHGGFTDETSSIYSGAPPLTMDPRRVFVADFNGDGRRAPSSSRRRSPI